MNVVIIMVGMVFIIVIIILVGCEKCQYISPFLQIYTALLLLLLLVFFRPSLICSPCVCVYVCVGLQEKHQQGLGFFFFLLSLPVLFFVACPAFPFKKR